MLIIDINGRTCLKFAQGLSIPSDSYCRVALNDHSKYYNLEVFMVYFRNMDKCLKKNNYIKDL